MCARHRESEKGIVGWFQNRMSPSKKPARLLIQENESASADIENSQNIQITSHSQSTDAAQAESETNPVPVSDSELLEEDGLTLLLALKLELSRVQSSEPNDADVLYAESLVKLISAIQDFPQTDPAQPPITSNSENEVQSDVHDGG